MKTRYKLGELWTPGQINELTSLLEGYVPMTSSERLFLRHYATAAVLYESAPYLIDCGMEDIHFNTYLDALKAKIKETHCRQDDCDTSSSNEDYTLSEFIGCVCEMSREPSSFSEWSTAFFILNCSFNAEHGAGTILEQSRAMYSGPFEVTVEFIEHGYCGDDKYRRLSVEVILNSKD